MKKFFWSPPWKRDTGLIGDPLEKTLVIIKGDIIARGLVGQIISQIEKLDLKIIASKTIKFDEQLIESLYGEHQKEEFYGKLRAYLLHGYHMAFVFQGREAINKIIQLKGRRVNQDKTKTLRKQYALDSTISSVHCSDDAVKAEKEIGLFFQSSEIAIEQPQIDFYEQLSTNMPISDHVKSELN